MQADNEWMIYIGKNVTFHFGALTVAYFKRGLLQNFHCIQSASVGHCDLAHEEYFAERAFPQNFKQFEMSRHGLLGAFLGYILYLDLSLVMILKIIRLRMIKIVRVWILI